MEEAWDDAALNLGANSFSAAFAAIAGLLIIVGLVFAVKASGTQKAAGGADWKFLSILSIGMAAGFLLMAALTFQITVIT